MPVPAEARRAQRKPPLWTLTNARIGALASRKTSYDIRDRKLRGFGVRVMASGRKRFFVHCQYRGIRVWKIVGDAGTMRCRGTVLAGISWARAGDEEV